VKMVLEREMKEDNRIEFTNKMRSNKTGNLRIT